MAEAVTTLDAENFDGTYLRFQDRQAGVSVIYDPDAEQYRYNAYCMETTLLRELVSEEFDFLSDAIEFINDEFGSWEAVSFDTKSKGCGNCAAKKS